MKVSRQIKKFNGLPKKAECSWGADFLIEFCPFIHIFKHTWHSLLYLYIFVFKH